MGTLLTPEGLEAHRKIMNHFTEIAEEFPSYAIFAIVEVLYRNKNKHKKNAWKKISIVEHLTHAIEHLSKFLSCSDHSEPHLNHCLTRLAMAVHLLYLEASKNATRQMSAS